DAAWDVSTRAHVESTSMVSVPARPATRARKRSFLSMLQGSMTSVKAVRHAHELCANVLAAKRARGVNVTRLPQAPYRLHVAALLSRASCRAAVTAASDTAQRSDARRASTIVAVRHVVTDESHACDAD